MVQYSDEQIAAIEKLTSFMMRIDALAYQNADINLTLNNETLLTLRKDIDNEIGHTDIEQLIINKMSQMRQNIIHESRELVELIQKRIEEIEIGPTYGMSHTDD